MMEIGSNLKRQRIADDEEHQIDIDRLTNLPDAVTHHILSFLTDIEDIARFNFTSKRCQHLCASIPSIVIDAAHITRNVADYLKISRFMDFLVTLIRCRTANLTSLTIRWFVVTLTPTQMSRIVSMLNSAATHCHATELNLTLRLQSTQVFVLPLDLFYNESLKSFKVNLMMGKLEVPCPYGFCHLRILRLGQVEIGDRDIGNWISSFCKFLKELYLEKISVMSKFTYSGSSLQLIQIIKCALHHLHISGKSLKNITIVDPFDSSIRASLDILAPNVQELMLRALLSNYYSLGKMDQLKVVVLSLLPAGMHKNNLNSLLPSIAQTGSLVIDSHCIKRMYDDGYLPLFRFNKLWKLILYHYGLTDDIIPSMVKCFQELQPGLKELIIIPFDGRKVEQRMSSMNPSGFGANFWKTQNSLLAGGLEKLVIKLAGGENEESFVEYLLNNATKLKKVVINPQNSLPLPIQIANKLINLSQANGATLLHHVGTGGVTFEA